MCVASAAFQTRRNESAATEASLVPSGVKANALSWASWRVITGPAEPSAEFQKRMLRSNPPVANVLPSGANAMQATTSSCPRAVNAGCGWAQVGGSCSSTGGGGVGGSGSGKGSTGGGGVGALAAGFLSSGLPPRSVSSTTAATDSVMISMPSPPPSRRIGSPEPFGRSRITSVRVPVPVAPLAIGPGGAFIAREALADGVAPGIGPPTATAAMSIAEPVPIIGWKNGSPVTAPETAS